MHYQVPNLSHFQSHSFVYIMFYEKERWIAVCKLLFYYFIEHTLDNFMMNKQKEKI